MSSGNNNYLDEGNVKGDLWKKNCRKLFNPSSGAMK